MVEGGSFEHIIKDAQDLLVSVKETIDNLNKEISDLNIAETTHKATRIIDHTAKRTKAVATEIQITSENLRRASETLENLLNRLNTDPSDIIFSEPPKGK